MSYGGEETRVESSCHDANVTPRCFIRGFRVVKYFAGHTNCILMIPTCDDFNSYISIYSILYISIYLYYKYLFRTILQGRGLFLMHLFSI